MSAWMPLAKAALPVLAKVAQRAIPAFATRKAQKSLEEQSAQVGELQAVATENAASIRAVAEQLEETVRVVDKSAEEMQVELSVLKTTLRRARVIALSALAVALIALLVAIAALRA